MLTDQDIKKLTEAQKLVFATKQDFLEFRDEIRKDFATLTASVDGYAQKLDIKLEY
jgi:hypothetical protein